MKVSIKALAMKFHGEKGAILLTATAKTGLLVGTVVVKDFEAGGCAEFSRLFVDAHCRHHGISHTLMAEVYSIAKHGKASGVSGYVKPDNLVALSFYRKEGFLPVWSFSDGDALVWRPL